MACFAGRFERRLWFLGLISVSLVMLADWLIYAHGIGWNVGLFGAAVLAAMFCVRRVALRSWPGRVVIGAYMGLLLASAVHTGPLLIMMLGFGAPLIASINRHGWRRDAGAWWGRVTRFFALMWARPIQDAIATRARRSAGGARDIPIAQIARWTLLVLFQGVFLALFYAANPVVEHWLDDAALAWERTLHHAWDLVEPLRIVFWVLTGVFAWGLLRVRWGRDGRIRAAIRAVPGIDAWRVVTGPGVVAALLVFNATFAVHTALDAAYLLGGAELPAGVTYAEYAQRGAYPLVATALLAGAFTLLAFGEHGVARRNRWARRLVYLWIAQNVLLLVSAIWRLGMYVDAYALTRMRVAAGIWMVLVGIGLLLIIWRIARERSGNWLLGANTIAAAVVFYACCFINFDAYIAEHNVRHCREAGGPGAPIDLEYLQRLGPESIPALRWLEGAADSERIRDQCALVARRLEHDLERTMQDWRAWTWRRSRLAQR